MEFETIGWLTTGMVGFAAYWSVLIFVALVEVALPGPRHRTPAGPRLWTNIALGLLAATLNSIPLLSEVAFAELIQANGLGLLNHAALPTWLHVLVSFLAVDLLAYAVHRASHGWKPLWRLHRVHHSDADIDLSTLFRIHPLSVPVLLAISFIAIAGIGIHPVGILLHGAAKLFSMGFGHANVAPRPGLSRIVSLLVVTPDFHRRHHSAWQPETDSNYGEVLTLWDQLFRSAAPDNAPVERFGLGDAYDADAASLVDQLKLPFITR